MDKVKTAMVLGGAQCVHDDIKAAQELFTADIIVAVKDIGITWPNVDYWATFHPERLPKELGERRKAGLPDPKEIWTHQINRPKGQAALGVPIKILRIRGGSSGLLGTEGALAVADRIVLCGIPLDPGQVHYKRPRRGGWPPAKMYRLAWNEVYPKLKDRVRSMSGWTKELLGAPTVEWLNGE
jgi:hypothetical protein